MSDVHPVNPVLYPIITSELLRAYAEASGDPNPIHLDADAAKAFGLPGIIAHGMLTAAWIADCAVRWVHSQGLGLRLERSQTKFKAMTFLGDTVAVSGSATPEPSGKWRLELVARNQRGEVTTTGVCLFGQ